MHFWVRCFVWQDPPASFAYTRQAAAYPRYGSSLAPLAGVLAANACMVSAMRRRSQSASNSEW